MTSCRLPVAALALAVLVSACGQTGPLVLPGTPAAEAQKRGKDAKKVDDGKPAEPAPQPPVQPEEVLPPRP